jgi:hypothetical protein
VVLGPSKEGGNQCVAGKLSTKIGKWSVGFEIYKEELFVQCVLCGLFCHLSWARLFFWFKVENTSYYATL